MSNDCYVATKKRLWALKETLIHSICAIKDFTLSYISSILIIAVFNIFISALEKIGVKKFVYKIINKWVKSVL